MNKLIYIFFGILVIFNLAWALIPEVRDEIHWQLAKYEKTSMKSYIDQWPNGRHFDLALRANDELAWDIAADTNTIEGYARYLEKCKEGAFRALAKKYIESLHWESARNQHTMASYEKYISAYPKGKFTEKAKVGLLALRLSDESQASDKGKSKTRRSVNANDKKSMKAVQEKLASLGYNPGPIDGVFGKTTRTALRSFQQDCNIPKTGLPDSATLKRMGL